MCNSVFLMCFFFEETLKLLNVELMIWKTCLLVKKKQQTINLLFTDFTIISLFCAFTEVHNNYHSLSSLKETLCSDSHSIIANSQYQTDFQF